MGLLIILTSLRKKHRGTQSGVNGVFLALAIQLL
jgi:hypothetical protein